TNVVCASNYNYLNNQEGQNPCLVAAYLQVPCSSEGKNYAVPALDVNQTYVGPSDLDANYCACSSVVYSLISACSQCQGHTWVSWSYWRGGCGQDMLTVGEYPLDIPVGTGVPAWAYQNVGLTDRWNQSLALPQVSVAPESTYYGTPTASISYHVSTAGDVATQTGATGAGVSQTGSPSTGSSKSNAGPIAGGVIGGIALLALIGALVWLLIRRRGKDALAPSPTAYYPPGGPQMGEADYPAAVDYGASYPATTSPTIFSGNSTTPNPPKLYDPEDPSTFPKTPASFGYESTAVTDSVMSPSHDGSTPVGGRYTGAAEI
ncbi:hypothetical protein M407DRAFT_241235, partial [Tulasnella calospora MUT 4182]